MSDTAHQAGIPGECPPGTCQQGMCHSADGLCGGCCSCLGGCLNTWPDDDTEEPYLPDVTDQPAPQPTPTCCQRPGCSDFALAGTTGCLVHIPADSRVRINQLLREQLDHRPAPPRQPTQGDTPTTWPATPVIPARPYHMAADTTGHSS